MNHHDLQIFAAVAQCGSITRAARTLATVQSNVTTRIRRLESGLGVQLFHRTHRGITLTAKGEELLPFATQLLSLAQQAARTISGTTRVDGRLRIGCLQSTASVRLPGILKAFIASHAQVDITIETGTAAELTGMVLDHSVDGAFIAGPLQHPELTAQVACVEEIVLVTPRRYRSLAQFLAAEPIPKVLVFKVGCFYRKALERLLSLAGVHQLREMEFGTLDGIIGCVGAGLGITLLPRSVIERCGQREAVRVHALGKDIRAVETLFIALRAPVPSPALARFSEVVRAVRDA